MPKTRWRVYARQDDDLVTHLSKIRGLTETDLALDFANLHDPNLLPDMKAARELMKKAVKAKWFVTIFGDYDADGTPASAVLATLMERLGLRYKVVIPTRADGYGLKLKDVEIAAKSSQLLITVDTGIAAVEEITLAKKLGLAVIVLDHHLPKTELPPADAVIDPYVPGSKYPFNYLCGCALAYKFVEALSADFPGILTEGFRKWLLDLVAISTVADMMVMKGENRLLVHYGLQVLRKTQRLGLQALLDIAGLDPLKLSAENLGYVLGPRLNASGRMGDNYPAFELLMAKTIEEAQEKARIINQLNTERQGVMETATAEAEKALWAQNKIDDHLFVIAGDAWPAGVIGLSAGKLSYRHNRPVVILTGQGEELTGSARSIGEYSIIDGLDFSAEHLLSHGGHQQAAGLRLKKTELPKFVDSLKAHAKKNIAPEDLVPVLTADAILTPDEVSLTTAKAVEKLAPFGQANPSPKFIIKYAKLDSPRTMGKDGRHLKWQAKLDGRDLEVVGFGLAGRFAESPHTTAHLFGALEQNHWNGNTRLQFKLADYQPTDHRIEKVTRNS
ncbi:MAG TPA: single-stranded-DNA-specific exonuclease RecJ [Candidatus Saccharimonadales bacterium]|nr:single-stranded-DNA-specific exonuclease RecJ [Candidatus Saccharimonadales bacterium]